MSKQHCETPWTDMMGKTIGRKLTLSDIQIAFEALKITRDTALKLAVKHDLVDVVTAKAIFTPVIKTTKEHQIEVRRAKFRKEYYGK